MERRLDELVDVMSVPPDGDAANALVRVPDRPADREIDCEVLVAGGGTGGVAAALAAARRGRRTCLIEETDWLGGQLSAQGNSALDEHDYIESFGGTASYYGLRDRLRDHYRTCAGAAGKDPAFNPGACWVTRLAFEPAVASRYMYDMLAPFVASGMLSIFFRTKTVAADAEEGQIRSLTALDLEVGHLISFRAAMVIDATELGDLLPLAGVDYRVGAESVAQTGETHAQPQAPKPHCVQSFTYPFVAERRPDGENHVIPAPHRYVHYRDAQPYSLTIEVHGGEIYGEDSGWLEYKLFERMPGTKGGLWTYRRLLAASQFGTQVPYDLAMINWPSNDYRDRSIIDRPAGEVAAALQDAKRVSLGFLLWLQTEAPVEACSRGAPELRLRPDLMGTADGLSKFPYIRESRRIVAHKTVVEEEVSAHFQAGPRAAHFDDSVGIGWYPIDIHRAGPEDVGISCRTRPFQIPLGALLPVRTCNLIAGCKNIGTTHITNGSYRLHPVEWNIGEAAGAVAAFAIAAGLTLSGVRDARLTEFQRSLLADGMPLAWVIDVGVKHPAFAAVQDLFMTGKLAIGLRFEPDAPLAVGDWHAWGGRGAPPATRAEGALCLYAR
ncbi:FAD-dependent oxidoreductase [bacterium]|nr:FAD-dependent oxidoreductase [bacterium]NDD11363.1 FAD-dependent oxidoreductase [Betaproteobacteria bacterium]